MSKDSDRSESKQEWLRLARISAYLVGVGFQMAVIVAAFTLGGLWLDKKIGWSYVLAISGAVIGFGLSLWMIFRSLKRLQAGDE